MMTLIADSGSTRTDWVIADGDAVVARFTTSGLNPAVMGIDRCRALLAAELLPHIRGVALTTVAFYGAGCTPALCPAMRDCLAALLPMATITVASDLVGACRAVCGTGEGIVAILGTGSNSCLYDGQTIIARTPSLGYILWDEGSGAALGTLFLRALLRAQLPTAVAEAFTTAYALTTDELLARVYRAPQANTFLASLAPFLRQWSGEAAVYELIMTNFRNFFARHIRPYGRGDLPVHCVGGVAYHFADILSAAAAAEGFTLGTICAAPLAALPHG